MKRFWVSFKGTSHGCYVEASSMKVAKEIFAASEGVSMSSYITARRA